MTAVFGEADVLAVHLFRKFFAVAIGNSGGKRGKSGISAMSFCRVEV